MMSIDFALKKEGRTYSQFLLIDQQQQQTCGVRKGSKQRESSFF
jgi:hypothetical protein